MREFHFVPSINELDVTIDEENLVKAWKEALNFFAPDKYLLERAKSLTDYGERKVLYNILSDAVDSYEYPVLKVQPCGSEYVYTYRLDEIEEEYSYEFFNFCSEAIDEVATDLGLLY